MRTVTKSNSEQDIFSFMSKRRKYADVLPVLAQNKSILHMACTLKPSKLTPAPLQVQGKAFFNIAFGLLSKVNHIYME